MSLKRWIAAGGVIAMLACSDESTQVSASVIAMRFVSHPSTVSVDSPFSTTVELLGPDGERATSATDAVTLSLVGTGTLTGTTTVLPVQGTATFSGLRVSSASETLQLKATAAGIVATSPSFKATDDCAPIATSFPITLTGTLANAPCVLDGRPTIFYRFTKPSLGPVQFVVTAENAAFVPEITVINDPPSDFLAAAPTGATATGAWVLPAAPYRLRVSSLSGTSAGFTISTSTAAPPGCVLRTLLPFALVTYTGTVEPGDCFESGRHYDWYRLYSPKPCTLTMHGVSAGFDSFISVRNALTHEIVAENDNVGSGVAPMDASITLAQCRAGTDPIEILAMSSVAGGSGEYTLSVQITGGVSTFLIGAGASRR